MGIPKGYKKTSDDMKFFYSSPRKKSKTKPKDSLPKGTTAEKFKEKYAKVVWCDYYSCIHNESPEGASRKIGTILENPNYQPLGTQDESWKGVCNKKEIGIRFKTITGAGNLKHKVPECFNAASNKTGRMDMSRLMQGGSAIGGSIESQSGDQGYTNYSFGSKWEGK